MSPVQIWVEPPSRRPRDSRITPSPAQRREDVLARAEVLDDDLPLVAPLHPLFATANAILGTLTATETIDRIARAGILRIFKRHFASLALVKLLLRVFEHSFN